MGGGDGSDALGGGLYNGPDDLAALSDVNVNGNRATGGDAGPGGNDG